MRPFEIHDPYGIPGEAGTITIQDITIANLQAGGPTRDEATRFEKAYEKELHLTDSALREFFNQSDSSGLSQNTVVIITSDHGEEFGEHDMIGFHSISTYSELIHVPLILILPHVKPTRISQSVEIRSIPATILDIVGQAIPPGIAPSPLPLFRGKEKRDRLVEARTAQERTQSLTLVEANYQNIEKVASREIKLTESVLPFTTSSISSVIQGPWHAIKQRDGSVELYKLMQDPNESSNLLQKLQNLPGADSARVDAVLNALTSN